MSALMTGKMLRKCGLVGHRSASPSCSLQHSPGWRRVHAASPAQACIRQHAFLFIRRHHSTARRRLSTRHVSEAAAVDATRGGAPQVAMNGDIVHVHYICRDEQGNIVDDSAGSEEPVCFEVGAGEVTGNPLFQAFDEAIRGCALGETAVLEAKGGKWMPDLYFEVPRDHQEITRLEGRYKSQGGLKEGMVIELANGESAMVVAMKDHVVAIDANNMMAGKTRSFEVTLQHIEPAKR